MQPGLFVYKGTADESQSVKPRSCKNGVSPPCLPGQVHTTVQTFDGSKAHKGNTTQSCPGEAGREVRKGGGEEGTPTLKKNAPTDAASTRAPPSNNPRGQLSPEGSQMSVADCSGYRRACIVPGWRYPLGLFVKRNPWCQESRTSPFCVAVCVRA